MPYKKKESLFSRALKAQEGKSKKVLDDDIIPHPSEIIAKETVTEKREAIKPVKKTKQGKPSGNKAFALNLLDWRVILIAIIALFLAFAITFTFISMNNYKTEVVNKETDVLGTLDRIIIPENYFQASAAHDFTYMEKMKAAKLTPGVDIYSKAEATSVELEAEVDAVIATIKELNFNSIIVDTRLNDSVIYKSATLKSTGVDLLSIIINKAKAAKLSVVAVFNATGVSTAEGVLIDNLLSADNKLTLQSASGELASYELSSIMIDSYYTKRDAAAYAKYNEYGAVEPFKDWIYSNTFNAVKGIKDAIEISASSMPTGLLIKDVWADATKKEGGSKTESSFNALTDGFVDTKKLIEDKAVYFASIEIETSLDDTKKSFKEISAWWNTVCEGAKTPMYITHRADRANNAEYVGWNRTDQLAQQVAVSSEYSAYKGSGFVGLDNLVENKDTSTKILLQYFDNKYAKVDLMQGLDITSPKDKSTVVYEESVQFRGKFDPNQEVLLNGTKVEPSSRGGFSVWVPLKVGKNTITLEHKGEKHIYNVERRVIIFKEWGPTKDMKVSGSSQLEFNITAYKGSKISATLNGKTVQLTETERGDQSQLDSGYVYYVGSYTMPKATNKVQNIGGITFNGNYQGHKETKYGSKITIDKLLDDVDPDSATGQIMQHAVINRTYAYTYPYKTMPEFANGALSQLPEGTQDIVSSVSGNFVNLRSGKTVKLADVTLTDTEFVGNNNISQFTAGVEGNDTVIRATMGWKAPFSVSPSPYPNLGSNGYKFNSDSVTILLDYTTIHAKDNFIADMSASPIFSDLTIERVKNAERNIWQYKITLPLREAGKYYGVHAQYEDNTLVLRFNHPPQSGSLSGVTIIVDPGHGGTDYGTMAGRDVVEKNVNLPMAEALKAALESKGANVIMSRTGDETIQPDSRTRLFHSMPNADLLISVHHNATAGGDPGPHGIETFFNTPFSQPLAAAVNAQVSQYMYSRGAKYYNFFQIRDNQYPSILVEYAFLSNPSDESMALDPSHQATMAEATAQGVVDYFNR